MLNKTQPVSFGPYPVGGDDFVVIAGPCSIESKQQFSSTAESVKASGAVMLRGGMFKLRTDPKSFQGLGQDAYSIAHEVRKRFGMPFVSEVTDPREIEAMLGIVDVFQVGSRNMHNYALLKELGSCGKPVLLKRGFSALIKEWILAAEYLVKHGNSQVVLCERGIRTFETATRNTFDLNAIAYVKQTTGLPVIADPSHATGASSLVEPMALAAAAAGADGLIVEVHPRPAEALSDGFQALTFPEFDRMMHKLERVLNAIERPLARSTNERVSQRPEPGLHQEFI
jgi:3-deoxy-7-phosphoheptulonate synthase